MRSPQRDHSGAITFGGIDADAASGSGVAQPGAIPYSFTRTSTGTYVYYFDGRLSAIHVEVAGYGTAMQYSTPTAPSNGTFTIQVRDAAGTLANSSHQWSCTALDKRL